MTIPSAAPARSVVALVLIHLAVSFVHGNAHAQAGVGLSAVANLFVYIVILAAPLAGLVLMRFSMLTGLWIVAGSLFASLIFGLINHFVLESPDHVSQVGPPWHLTFTVTAALLAATEALGTLAAVWSIARVRRFS